MKKQFLLLSMLLLSNLLSSQIPDSEKQALLALYDSLNNGVEWTGISSTALWNDTNSISDWWGITIEDDHVTEINLSISSLNGTISSKIEDLIELKKLYITSTQIMGVIPSEIEKLINLEDLILFNNKLNGIIPSQLSKCINLTSLYLDDNQFTGNIPDSLGDLSLTQFFINGNQLSGDINSILPSWPDLVFLGLDSFTGNLDLSNNPKIVIFFAPDNQFTTINVKNGNNTVLTNFRTTNSPNLTCIQVDNPTDASNGVSSYQHWNTDSTVTFSEDCSTLSVSDYVINSGLIFYPNPTKGLISIKSELNNIIEIKIYNYTGKLLYSEESKNGISTINISKLNVGIYLIKFKDNLNNISISKFIKN